MHLILRVAILLNVGVQQGLAFSTGAGGCEGGDAAVDGLHLDDSDGRPVVPGTLLDGAIQVTIGETVLDPDIAMDFPMEEDLLVSVAALDIAYLGILMRLQAPEGVDSSAALVAGANVQDAGACFAPIRGITHTDNTEKTLATGTIRFDEEALGVRLEITNVFVNVAAGSAFVYDAFELNFRNLDVPTAVPTATPTELPPGATSRPTDGAAALTNRPTELQTNAPTELPPGATSRPTDGAAALTNRPTVTPTGAPVSGAPAATPTSVAPTVAIIVTTAPTAPPTIAPTNLPTISAAPSILQVTQQPSVQATQTSPEPTRGVFKGFKKRKGNKFVKSGMMGGGKRGMMRGGKGGMMKKGKSGKGGNRYSDARYADQGNGRTKRSGHHVFHTSARTSEENSESSSDRTYTYYELTEGKAQADRFERYKQHFGY